MISRIKNHLNRRAFDKSFRQKNIHNQVYAANEFPIENVNIGNCSYGNITVLSFGGTSKLQIGHFCSIASGVVFNLSGDHPTNRVSTFPFMAKALNGKMNEAASKGDIIIEDDVWIGQNAIIMSGITIGQGAVVAAGAVVTSTVPPYAIVGGVPAKIIRYRFEQPIIDYLLTLDYGSLTEGLIKEHLDALYRPVHGMSLDDLEAFYGWFPKRTANHSKKG